MYHQIDYKIYFLLTLAISFLLCIPVSAQQNQQNSLSDISKGKFIVLKIPGRLVGFDKVSWWSGNHTSVELKDALFNVKLRFDNSVKDLSSAFREVAFVGLLSEFEASDYYQKEVIGKVLPTVFNGSLTSIPANRKLNLLKELRYIDSAIKSEKYKGNNYLSVNVGGDTQIYNMIRVDQTSRLGDSLNDRILSYFKRIARVIKFHRDVDGIKISVFVPYKNFVTEAYSEPHYDRLEIYAAMDVIQQFADDELTNQEFVDEAIVLVNGNRMQISNVKSL